MSDPVKKGITKYRNNSCILVVKDKIGNLASFSCNEASLPDIKRVKSQCKASTSGNKPPKILRASKESCSETAAELFSSTLLTSSFPTELKVEDVSPVFKKDDPLKMKNYRPNSVLPNVSKIFERLLYKQRSLHVVRFPTFVVTKNDLAHNRH